MSAGFVTAEATDVADRPEGWTSDKWATPWPILHGLEAKFGKFDLDPCCESHTAKAPTFYTVDDDGLSKPWFGNVFVNPPYSDPRSWCERALRAVESSEAEQVVMLLPCATDTAWFHDVVWPNAELHYLRGRVRFLGWRGTPLPSPRSPSLVAVFKRDTFFDWRPVRNPELEGREPCAQCGAEDICDDKTGLCIACHALATLPFRKPEGRDREDR